MIHTCKFKHRLNETTSWIYGSQMCQTPQKHTKCEENDWNLKGGVDNLLCLLGPILCGALILVFYCTHHTQNYLICCICQLNCWLSKLVRHHNNLVNYRLLHLHQEENKKKIHNNNYFLICLLFWRRGKYVSNSARKCTAGICISKSSMWKVN